MGLPQRQRRARGLGQRTALVCDKKFLSKLLDTLGRDLVLLTKLQFYRKRDRYDKAQGSGGEFAHSFLIATIDHALNVRFATPTAAHFAAIRRLRRANRHEFQKRLKTLTRLAGSNRGKSVSAKKRVERKRKR